MRRVVFALLVVVCCASTALAQKRGLLPQDYYKEVGVSEVTVSPSGSMVAFTVTTVVEDQDRRHKEVWLQRVREGAPDGEPFRFTVPAVDSYSPRWSPDGTSLAFTSPRKDDPNTIWMARVFPVPGEPHHVAGLAGTPVWSPDGKWMAFTTDSTKTSGGAGVDAGGGAEKVARSGWIASDSLSHTLDETRFDGRVITSMRYKRDGTPELLPDPQTRGKRQLMVVPAEGGTPRRLTDGSFDVGSISWSRDSRLIFYSGDERQDDEYNQVMTENVFVVSRDGGAPRPVTSNPGGERSPVCSPAADRLAFIGLESRNTKPNVYVVDLAPDGSFAGEPRNLTANWELTPNALAWTPDGTALRFDADVHGDVHIFEVRVAEGRHGAHRVRQVTSGDRTISAESMSRDGGVLAYTVDSPLGPTELYLASLDGSNEHKATSFNDAWLQQVALVPPERLTWKVADGTEIEGWLVKPVGFTPGHKYPLVLKIHGGPHSQYGNTWFSTFHVLSSAGMFVLYANPRGSTGYGYRFTYATRGKWGELDTEDLLKGIDVAASKHREVDLKRLGVSGGSYGGFMTNWLTATTRRFAAAVSSRSIVNWESWYGTSDSQGLTEFEFYGAPWEQRELYRRLSPISYVEEVRAPTLIIEGENDYRTPMGEGEQWFMALKKRQIPAELVRYPRSSHGLSRSGEPWLLVDRLERIRSWFVRWLVDAPAVTTH